MASDPILLDLFSNTFQHTEEVAISNFKAVLTYVPTDTQSFSISNMTEVTTTPSTSSEYKVNYQNGVVEFHTSIADGTKKTPTYYARGVTRSAIQRVVFEDTGNLYSSLTIEEALQEVMNKTNTNTSEIAGMGGTLNQNITVSSSTPANTNGLWVDTSE